MLKKLVILPLFGILLAVGCGKDECDTSNASYNGTVKAILDANCTSSGCHEANSVNGSLASYQDAKDFAANGRIAGSINRQGGFSPMPQGANKMDACDIKQIETWINNGTPQ